MYKPGKSTIGLIFIGIIGLVTPFIDSLVIIELYFLILPMVIIFVISLILLIIFIFTSYRNLKLPLYSCLVILTFILAQLASVFMVHKVQRFRSQRLIEDIEAVIHIKGKIPDSYGVNWGIEYKKIDSQKKFTIRYSRGFMVVEVYSSDSKTWQSQGWMD